MDEVPTQRRRKGDCDDDQDESTGEDDMCYDDHDYGADILAEKIYLNIFG